MADRPIIFSAAMARALLEGRKTQTRRVIKKPAALNALSVFGPSFLLKPGNVDLVGYASGDRLWVRESGHLLREAYEHDPEAGDRWRDAGFQHTVDGAVVPARAYDTPLCEWLGECSRHNRPSIHMPRWASRLTLTVTEVLPQRLQEISEEDALAEGVDETDFYEVAERKVSAGAPWSAPRLAFADLWNHIHGPGAWDANPWIVALNFTVARSNIDALAAQAEGGA